MPNIAFAEYGFLFTFGLSRSEPALAEKDRKSVQKSIPNSHIPTAPTAHQYDSFIQKWRTSSIAAGKSYVKFRTRFISRDRNSPCPVFFVFIKMPPAVSKRLFYPSGSGSGGLGCCDGSVVVSD